MIRKPTKTIVFQALMVALVLVCTVICGVVLCSPNVLASKTGASGSKNTPNNGCSLCDWNAF